MGTKDPIQFLKDWAKQYFKHKDLIHKKIKEIKEKNNQEFILEKEDHTVDVQICPNLDSLKNVNGKNHIYIVTLHNMNNINTLLKRWDELVHCKSCNIIFINPFSSQDTK